MRLKDKILHVSWKIPLREIFAKKKLTFRGTGSRRPNDQMLGRVPMLGQIFRFQYNVVFKIYAHGRTGGWQTRCGWCTRCWLDGSLVMTKVRVAATSVLQVEQKKALVFKQFVRFYFQVSFRFRFQLYYKVFNQKLDPSYFS